METKIANLAAEFNISLSSPSLQTSEEEKFNSNVNQLIDAMATKIRESQAKPTNIQKTPIAHQSREELLHYATNLRQELKDAQNISHDVAALKKKCISLTQSLSKEKKHRFRDQEQREKAVKHVEMLSDHVEKVMKLLKSESTLKIRAVEATHREHLAHIQTQKKIQKQSRTIEVQTRLIRELREGSKILEGQLRLMDEKFIELRFRLDTTRSQQKTQVERIKKECQELRLKYSLFIAAQVNMMGAHAFPPSLDTLPLPTLTPVDGTDNAFMMVLDSPQSRSMLLRSASASASSSSSSSSSPNKYRMKEESITTSKPSGSFADVAMLTTHRDISSSSNNKENEFNDRARAQSAGQVRRHTMTMRSDEEGGERRGGGRSNVRPKSSNGQSRRTGVYVNSNARSNSVIREKENARELDNLVNRIYNKQHQEEGGNPNSKAETLTLIIIITSGLRRSCKN